MPAITVAITTHNLEMYLQSCFAELEAQTFQDFSVLLYDDCSTDGTREVLEQLQLRWGDRLEVILGEVPQKMPARSRNRILSSGKVTGKYIVFLDGDDSLEPDFLMQLYLAAEEAEADVAICAYDRVEEESGHVLCREMQGFPQVCDLGEENSVNLAFLNTALWNKLIRRDRIGNLRMPDFPVGEDAAFLLAIYSGCKTLAFVDQILIHYRVRATSVISNTPEESIYAFAAELHRLWSMTGDSWMKDNVGLAAFIHIGISMPIRGYHNPNVDIGRLLSWIENYFGEAFNWLRGNRYMRVCYLARQGVKGLGILTAYWFHRLHCFRLFLAAYEAMTRILHMEVKF